jgi:hypothetical protein
MMPDVNQKIQPVLIYSIESTNAIRTQIPIICNDTVFKRAGRFLKRLDMDEYFSYLLSQNGRAGSSRVGISGVAQDK